MTASWMQRQRASWRPSRHPGAFASPLHRTRGWRRRPGGGSVNPDGVALTRNGVVRVLKHLGVLKHSSRFKVPAAQPTRLMELGGQDYYVYAPEAGLFEPAARLGDQVKKDQRAGRVHFIDNPGRKGVSVRFKRDGFLICQRHFGRVEPGDCIAHLATDVRS